MSSNWLSVLGCLKESKKISDKLKGIKESITKPEGKGYNNLKENLVLKLAKVI